MAGDAFDRDLERLSAYIDDELTPDERQAVEARLAEDPALRAALDEMRANARLLAGLPRVRLRATSRLTPPSTAGVRVALTGGVRALRARWARRPPSCW
ncbi:MAG: zf-HC2 domain-containing protein [Anaerolineae bacterium]|nr:zf-HC2 domain-containing protein [Anaerolineae bacterium]